MKMVVTGLVTISLILAQPFRLVNQISEIRGIDLNISFKA